MIFSFAKILKSATGNPNHDKLGRFAKGSESKPFTPESIKAELDELGISKHYDEDTWHMIMGGVHPKEFFGTFLGKEHVTKENLSRLMGKINYDGIHFHIENPVVYGQQAQKIERRLSFTGREAKHDILKFSESNRGGGIAKKLLSESVKLYDKLGINKVKLFAGLDLGAYTWSKFGFKYQDDLNSEGHAQQVYENVLMAARTVGKANLTSEAKGELKDIVSILDKKSPVGNQLLAHMKTPHLDKAMKPLIEGRFPTKGTAMKLFMADTNYDGVLRLDDKNQMRMFRQYIKK